MLDLAFVTRPRCLRDGVVRSPEDADLGSILGWGFPESTGGVLAFVDRTGVARFTARARELAARYGERFEPPASLEPLAGRSSGEKR